MCQFHKVILAITAQRCVLYIYIWGLLGLIKANCTLKLTLQPRAIFAFILSLYKIEDEICRFTAEKDLLLSQREKNLN